MAERKRKVDWAAVQAYYDDGHTMAECKEHFGVSNGSWDRARLRGELRTRGWGGSRGRHSTRHQVDRLLKAGGTNADVARALGVSTATVSYHARKLGIPPDTRFSRRVDWTAVQAGHDQGMSVRQCAQKFGFHQGSWHKAVQRGAITPRSHVIPIEDLLVKGRPTGRDHLKIRLVKEGLKMNVCEECGTSSWQGKTLNMQLHHINGDGIDNRLVNLRFLCPNCHSQTDTYGGRNGHRKPDRHPRLVDPKAA